MDYESKTKRKKIFKIVAIAVGVLIATILVVMFFQAKHNAKNAGNGNYSVKEFIVDFGSAARGKQVSTTGVFDSGLFPIFGFNNNATNPNDGTSTDGTNGTTDGNNTDGNNNGNDGTDNTGNENPNSGGNEYKPQCADTVDNDGDGNVDMSDIDCTSVDDDSESPLYNWNDGNGDFYTYDDGNFTDTDFSGSGFDPDYSFDTDTPSDVVPQCVPKDYIFSDGTSESGYPGTSPNECIDGIDNDKDGKTDAADIDCTNEQALMDGYTREFFRIAPNLRTQADIDSEHSAKESYESLISISNTYADQCRDIRSKNKGTFENPPLSRNNPVHTRGVLPDLTNIDYSKIPSLGASRGYGQNYTTITNYLSGLNLTLGGYGQALSFFSYGYAVEKEPSPTEYSLPSMSAEDVSNIATAFGAKNLSFSTTSSVMIVNTATQETYQVTIPHPGLVLMVGSNSVPCPALTLFAKAYPGVPVGCYSITTTTTNNQNDSGVIDEKTMRDWTCIVRTRALCDGTPVPSVFTNASFPSQLADPSDYRYGACVLETVSKYQNIGSSGQINQLAGLLIIQKCYDTYVTIDSIRHAFEATFNVY